MTNLDYGETVSKYYQELLNRDPVPECCDHYIRLLEKNEVNEKQIVNEI